MKAHEITEVYVSAKEKKRNPGVKVGAMVAVKDPRSAHTLAFGKFARVGKSGLAHIILNAPLQDNGIVPQHLVGQKHVAVPQSWVFLNVNQAWPDEPWLAKKKAEQERVAAIGKNQMSPSSPEEPSAPSQLGLDY